MTHRSVIKWLSAALVLTGATGFAVWNANPAAPPGATVFLEELTWPEVAARIDAGATIALVPTGGTEQNGPHMVLGKHNYIVRVAAGRIALALGNALVAPVIPYVPEGTIEPPGGHMRFAGTLSVPQPVFADLLAATARSLRAHGFTLICLVGDSGGNQAAQQQVAASLNAEWADNGVRVLHVADFYRGNGQVRWLRAQGESDPAIGGHAGIRDTSELLAVLPAGIRQTLLAPGGTDGPAPNGVHGDPTRATEAYGEALLTLKVDAAVRQIRETLSNSR